MGEKATNLSTLFIHYNARRLSGDQDKDTGTSMAKVMEAIRTYGACTEAAWPFDAAKEGPPNGLAWGWTRTDDLGRFLIRGPADKAYEQGLNADDQIVAMDNMRVTKDSFNARMAEKKPGDVVNLTIFRFDDLSSLLIRLSEKREMSFRIVPVMSPTALQKQIYANWLR